MVETRQADPERDLAELEALWGEYLRWSNDRFAEEYGFRMDVEEILQRNLADTSPFAPPDGRLLLVHEDGVTLGVGCLKRIRPGTGEIKRMYVRPAARGRGAGRLLLERLLEGAREAGYGTVLLDSTRFMHRAHELYRAAGFRDTEPYPESEIPPELRHHWIFMRLELASAAGQRGTRS